MSYAFNWEYNFDPTFPVHIFPFMVSGNRDKMHWHQYFEIGLCINGSGKFVYMNKEYNVQKGDVFLSNNYENHVAISEKNDTTEYVFIIFLPSFIADPNGRQLDMEYLSAFKYNPLEFENKIDYREPTAELLYDLIMDTLRIYQGNDIYKKLEIDINLRKILLVLERHYSNRDNGFKTGTELINIKIQKAIKYINSHFHEKITIDHMAQILQMSPSYFRHLFKEHTQVSFKTYITYLRLSQAKKLLLATNKSINEIILEVGYSNLYQFYTIFKKFVSMSPTEYRMQYRNDK